MYYRSALYPHRDHSFLQLLGLDLSSTDAAALEDHTGGWIAGLQLVALLMQGHDDLLSLSSLLSLSPAATNSIFYSKGDFKMLSTLSNVIKRHSLITFFILAYALSWWLVPLGGLLPYGPLLAAIIVLAVSQGRTGLKELLSQITRWRIGWKWYLIAPGIVIAYTAGATGLNLLLGAQISPNYQPVSGVELLLLAALFLLLGGMWEEPGWTGYALPRLRAARSLLLASLIMGVFRNIWHLPLFLDGNIPWSDIVLNFTAQIFVSWLYYRTHRSVLMAMLLHFSSNYVAEIVFSLFEGGDFSQFNWLKTGLACLIALGLIIFDRKLWFASTPPVVVSESVLRV